MLIKNEKILNKCYNLSALNRPARIGYIMSMIRDVKPLTAREWREWYINNVHSENEITALGKELYWSVLENYPGADISMEDCVSYVNDVMFRRTFNGYNKEQTTLSVLRALISPSVQEAPAGWDTAYFIDFFFRTSNGQMVGIQLKPSTYITGKHYNDDCNAMERLRRFHDKFGARVWVLVYDASDSSDGITFTNPGALEKMRSIA